MSSESNTVYAGRLLTELAWAASAGKTRVSPATGATSPTQLAAVSHKSLGPPPSQTRTAAATCRVEKTQTLSKKQVLCFSTARKQQLVRQPVLLGFAVSGRVRKGAIAPWEAGRPGLSCRC